MLLSSLLLPIALAVGATAQSTDVSATTQATNASATAQATNTSTTDPTSYPDFYPGTSGNWPNISFISPSQNVSWVIGKPRTIVFTWPDANLTAAGELTGFTLNLMHKNITRGVANQTGARLSYMAGNPYDPAKKVKNAKNIPNGVTAWTWTNQMSWPNETNVGDGYYLQIRKYPESGAETDLYATSEKFSLLPAGSSSGALPTAPVPVAVAAMAVGMVAMVGGAVLV